METTGQGRPPRRGWLNPTAPARPRRRGLGALVLAAAILVPSSLALGAPSPQDSPVDLGDDLDLAATLSVDASVISGAVPGRIGIDLIYAEGGAGVYDIWPCTHSTRLPMLGWDEAGRLEGRSTFSDRHRDFGALTMVRFELYPQPCGHYDPWADEVGGVHLQRVPADGPNWLDLGRIPLPRAANGAFPIRGRLRSSEAITDGRIQLDVFQVAYGHPDTVLLSDAPQPPRTSTGVNAMAFATSTNRGDRWSGHWGWPGRYILFVRDAGPDGRHGTRDDVHVHGFTEIRERRIPTLDLDAICFGLDSCVYDQGAPRPVTGRFHTLDPVRIVDTRADLGLVGPLAGGDGRSSSPDPIIRRQRAGAHEIPVLGRHGLPRNGVAAVVVNLTAVDVASTGYAAVVPKAPSGTDVFDDQGTFARSVSTSNLNAVASETVSNLVVVPVGAGGIVRIFNRLGPLETIVDLVGWIATDTAAATPDPMGDGVRAVDPVTVFDSTASAPMRAGETLTVAVRDRAGLDPSSTAVWVNLTATEASAAGYVTAVASGAQPAATSALNLDPRGPRTNLALVELDAQGRIDIGVEGASTHLRVDVVAALEPRAGPLTVIAPRRALDTRRGLATPPGPLRPGAPRTVDLATAAGLPPTATAVLVNLTVTDATAPGRITLWRWGVAPPGVPTLATTPERTRANLVWLPLGPGGRIRMAASLAATEVILDVVGYVS